MNIDFLRIIFAFSILLIWFLEGKSQVNKIQKFRKLYYPEKIWIITHPFLIFKTMRISETVQKIAKEMEKDNDLDKDGNGGALDAFRHAFWMASLSQKIRKRAVRKLGIAHEKGNKIDFEKRKLEDGTIPDKISSEMDLKNNEIGIEIGYKNKNKTKEELIILIKDAVFYGKLWKIKKNKNGSFLDKNNKIINKNELKGKWENNKVLIKTNE